MVTKILGRKYFKAPLTAVNQFGKSFYVTIIPAEHLLPIFTVEPVEYDLALEKSQLGSSPDIAEYLEQRMNEKQALLDATNEDRIGFQRKYNQTRVNEISDYLNNNEYPFFPNSIIATCDLVNDLYDFDFKNPAEAIGATPPDSNLSYFCTEDGVPYLYIPLRSKSVLVIDGQHRLEGLKEAFHKYSLINRNQNYDLIVSFILDYDRSVIAELFYTINYTQKSVNKSLLYHLTGEFSRDLSEISFLHETVKLINEISGSPFESRVKMLGNSSTSEESLRPFMTISQAFLIDSLKPFIIYKKSNSLTQPIFYYYFKRNNKDLIIRFILSFFEAVRTIIPEWNSPKDNVISKSVGVGALIKIMNMFFIKFFISNGFYNSPLKIFELNSKSITQYLKGIEFVDWDRYAKQSSGGTLNQIRNEIVENMDYLGSKCLEDNFAQFKADYSSKFSSWLQTNS